MGTESDPPLSLASIDQITDELARRGKGYVMALLMEPSNEQAERDCDNILYRWAGGSVQALGLVAHLRRILGRPHSE